MQPNKEELARYYAEMTSEELLRIHAAGEPIEFAYEVLEAELKNRAIPIPTRPDVSKVSAGRPQSLRAHWDGRASLASAYWFVGVLGSLVLSFVVYFIDLLGWPSLSIAVRVMFVAYIVFALVSVWRCAWNTSWKPWGYIARTIVALNLIGIVTGLVFALFTPVS